MKRRRFVRKTMVGSALLGSTIGISAPRSAYAQFEDDSFGFRRNFHEDVVVERDMPGQPHRGKVLVLIMAHADDHLGTGTAAKLIEEGYTGYFIRVTNEDKSQPRYSVGEAVDLIAQDTDNVGKAIGCKKTYNLGYSKHDMEDVSLQELRARFIYLFRLLKVDTIITFDPWSHYEENPDHYITAQAVEAARWHANSSKDYTEHFKAGLKPHRPRERYYFSRGPNLNHYNFTQFNRIVDISSVIEKKIHADVANAHWGITNRRDYESVKKRWMSGGFYQEPWMSGGWYASIAKEFGFEHAEFFNYMSG
jgi:LmbE family N-acetylglucosaminyl deacetylase